jgi:hypothetical protein
MCGEPWNESWLEKRKKKGEKKGGKREKFSRLNRKNRGNPGK